MKGVILVGGSGTRLRLLTAVVSKQLLPVFDKPMIHHPLSTLIHTGVFDVLVLSTPTDNPRIEELLGAGTYFEINISHSVQEKPEGLAQRVNNASSFASGENFWFIVGDSFFHGSAFGVNNNVTSSDHEEGALVFSYHKIHSEAYFVVKFNDQTDKVIDLIENSDLGYTGWAVPGLYRSDSNALEYFKKLPPSKCGELETIILPNKYQKKNCLTVTPISRGNAWFDLGSLESLQIGA